jgi:hypothetical protein
VPQSSQIMAQSIQQPQPHYVFQSPQTNGPTRPMVRPMTPGNGPTRPMVRPRPSTRPMLPPAPTPMLPPTLLPPLPGRLRSLGDLSEIPQVTRPRLLGD